MEIQNENTSEQNIDETPKQSALSKFILAQKIPSMVINVLFYLLLCVGNWYSARMTMLGMMSNAVIASSGCASILGNDVFAFFFGGFLPLLIFELISNTCVVSLNRLNINGRNVRYGIKIFYGIANLLYGAFTLVYIAFPPLMVYGETIIKFVFLTGAFALFLWFACRHYVPKHFMGRVVQIIAIPYIAFNLIFALYNFISIMVNMGA